jgi:3-oxoacyl-[acyl-carrier-protein] synthase II
LTPLGTDADSTWAALLAGKFITDHSLVPLARAPGQERVAQIALATAQEALASARWTQSHVSDPQTALVVATSKGPVESWLQGPITPAGGSDPVFGLAEVSTTLASALRLGAGPRLTLSAACSSGLHALIRAAMLVRSGEARRALVIAAESSVHPLFLASFKRLGILPPPNHGCRPFDRNRAGFLMSEAAAAVCIEASGPADRGPGVFLDRFALAADATHLTGTDPAAGALRYALRRVIDGRPVDLVHAHGTGTEMNDELELRVVEEELPSGTEDPPVLYSHKAALGHSLGAAGLVAVVLNCLAHRQGTVPPNPRTQSPLPTTRVIFSTHPVRRAVRRSTVMAAGFGGAVAAVSLCSR